MSVSPIITSRETLTHWPTLFTFTKKCNVGGPDTDHPYIDIVNSAFCVTGPSIFNDGKPIRLTVWSGGGEPLFSGKICFTSSKFRLGDLAELKNHPIGQEGWTFEMEAPSSFDNWIAIKYSVINIKNPIKYKAFIEKNAIITSRKYRQSWPSHFKYNCFDLGDDENSTKFVDLANSKLVTKDRIFNNGLPVYLQTKISNENYVNTNIIFKDQTINLSDVHEMFADFPVVRTLNLKMDLDGWFNSWIALKVEMVEIENESDYMENCLKLIGQGPLGVDVGWGSTKISEIV